MHDSRWLLSPTWLHRLMSHKLPCPRPHPHPSPTPVKLPPSSLLSPYPLTQVLVTCAPSEAIPTLESLSAKGLNLMLPAS